MANYDVGPLPTDAQLEAHLPPCPDDADFDLDQTALDKLAARGRDRCPDWDVILAHDRELMALKRRVKELEEKLAVIVDILNGHLTESSETNAESSEEDRDMGERCY